MSYRIISTEYDWPSASDPWFLPEGPAPFGSVVTATVRLEDEAYEPAVEKSTEGRVYNVTRPVGKRVQHGAVAYTETWLGLPEVTSPLQPLLWFEDGRPAKLVRSESGGEFVVLTFEFVAVASARPVLFLTGEVTESPVELPALEVQARPIATRRPRFGIWDGWTDQTSQVGSTLLQPETVGVDLTMQALSGQSKPSRVNAGYRGYNTIRGARWVEGGVQANTARHFPTPTTVSCIWFHDTVTKRYSNEGVRELLDGKFDDDIRADVSALPLDVVAYRFPLHEADYYGGQRVGLDPVLYCKALVHYLEVAADEALRRGRTPQNFGIGGLLTDGPMSRGYDDPWAWYRGLPEWLLDTGFVVGAWDSYRLMRDDVTRQPFRPRVDAAVAAFREGLVERFFIAETAQGLDLASARDTIVGDVDDTLAYLAEVEKWLVEVGEFAFLFSKESGEMSRNGSLTRPGLERAARKAYYIGQKFNIPVVAL